MVESKRNYLGQMDLNAGSEGVWEFYDETLKVVRLRRKASSDWMRLPIFTSSRA